MLCYTISIELPPIILKETKNEITPFLSFIFNQSLLSGEVPNDWLRADIFALHKKDRRVHLIITGQFP